MSSFRIEKNSSECRVAIDGGLTAALIPELQASLKQEMSSGATFVFDMQNADMIDSSGIGLLIAASNSLDRLNGVMRVVNVRSEIVRLLRSMRLVSRLNISEISEQSHG